MKARVSNGVVTWYDDAMNELTRESYTAGGEQEYNIRKIKAMEAARYIRSLVTAAAFQNIQDDLRNHLGDYERGSDRLIAWLNGTAPYAANGFPSKNYYSVQRRDA